MFVIQKTDADGEISFVTHVGIMAYATTPDIAKAKRFYSVFEAQQVIRTRLPNNINGMRFEIVAAICIKGEHST